VKLIKENIIECNLKTSFSAISGLDSCKTQLRECLILPNLRPDIFQGIRAPPKGILFYGPPGNGKTMLARAVAAECKCTFFNFSASTLVSKYMGEAEKILSMLFKMAYNHQPSIIYIDEVGYIFNVFLGLGGFYLLD
jgi:ATP-dependent 26S proteasome regulatory subunit